MQPQGRVEAYADHGHDRVRAELETGFFARAIPELLQAARGGRVLDLGCGDGLAERLAGPRLESYTGVDLRPVGSGIAHDLREGLGPVGARPYDVYLGTFGVASHMSARQFERLVRDIAAHARPGSIVALEALGLNSLEWPGLWASEPGPGRVIPYRLGADVPVHPWAPAELAAIYERAGISFMWAIDRTVQAGPKTGEGRYWPGMPPLRRAMNELLAGRDAAEMLRRPLPPLPAGSVAATHHRLAAARRRVLRRRRGAPQELARAVWSAEPRSGGGFGHGLLVAGRVA